jgi:hypothetical protein
MMPNINHSARVTFFSPLIRITLTLSLLLFGVSYRVFAQESTGTIVGQVTEASGGVIPNATVHIKNVATNTIRTVTTDGSGDFNVPFLTAGRYTVAVEASGFQTRTLEGVTLEVGQTARVDTQLKVGTVSETVQVDTVAVATQTEDAVVGTVIDAHKIVDLPLNGRNFVQLAQLIPGANPGTPASITVRRGRGTVGQTDSGFGSTSVGVNGQRDFLNRYFIDGLESMDYDAVTFSFSPSVDSISQFKVETSTSSAGNGGAAGAQISLVTKSGTNNLHGTLWEFNRNNAFTQTYDAIAKADAPSPRLNRNLYGANIGGPIYIPHLYNGHGKSFFFFNWESGTAVNGTSPTRLTVPTTDEVTNGNFAGLKNTSGALITLRNPFTGLPFPNNQVNPTLFSPQSLIFLKYTPVVTAPINSTNNFSTPIFSATSTQNDFTFRIDHNIRTKDILSFYYIWNNTYNAGVQVFGHDADNNLAMTRNYNVTETHVFNSSVVNSFELGYHTFGEVETFGTTGNPAYNIATQMGIPFAPNEPRYYGPPTITISGPDGVFSTYNLQRQIGPRNRSNSNWDWSDHVSWQLKRHMLDFGGDLLYRNVTFDQIRNPRGSFTFNGQYTGSALVDFLLGYIQNDSSNPTHTSTNLYDIYPALYLQDNYKMTRNLTINLGVRWDYFQPYTQANDLYADIYQSGKVATTVATPQSGSLYGRGLIQSNWKDVGPRIGFAWSPYPTTVVRGGYGIYYTTEISNAYFAMAEGGQAVGGATLTGNVGVPNLTFANPFPGTSTTGPNTYPFAVSNDQHLQDPYIQQYNFTVEQTLPGQFQLTTSYVGAKDTHLTVTYPDFNQPITLLNGFLKTCTAGVTTNCNPPVNSRRPNQFFQRAVAGDKSNGASNYNALQVKLERRVSNGFTLLTAYTWSKCISGPSDVGGQIGGGNFIGAPQSLYFLNLERSICGFDVPQRFVTTVLYDIPFFKKSRPLVRYPLAGWQVSTIITAQSGFPGNVTNNIDTTSTAINSRPDQIANGYLPNGQRTPQHWFNTAAFVTAQPAAFGNSPRTGAFRMPGLINDDFSAVKAFQFTESKNLQLRFDFFNLFKHYNADPNTVVNALNSKTFGTVAGGVSGGYATRIIQFGGKFLF